MSRNHKPSQATEEWMRRRQLMEESLKEDAARFEHLATTLADRLNAEMLTRAKYFGRVAVSVVYQDGQPAGIDWEITGTIRK